MQMIAAAVIGPYHQAIIRAEKDTKRLIRNYLRRDGNHYVSMLKHTVSNWNHKVSFKLRTRLRINEEVYGITIDVEDPVFLYLDQGTSYRTRVMSPDYVPKSQPETFYPTGPGGSVVGIGRMPGIEARGWLDWIIRDFERAAFDSVDEIIGQFVTSANDW